ncbi:MAG: TetR/AcrR family transcriptional regulator [Phycisphaerales bacterium]|nr:TetR/AcrR family transcriptional regulator [Phycisphaerales bacterium]
MPEQTTHRETLLDAAQGLMLSKGFPATKVDEICKAAGVTKGSFYYHFESKDDLARALIDHYFNRLTKAFEGEPWMAFEDPAERVYALLDAVIGVMKGPLLKHGCLLGSFALDLSETHPDIRRAIDERFAKLVGVIEPHLRAALKKKPKQSGINAKALSSQFLAVLQGAIVLSKASGDHAQLAASMRCYKEMVRAVLESN